jgi:hypothetical protein
MTRDQILRGPCKITFGGQAFYSKGDVKIAHQVTTVPVPTSRFGKVDERVSSVMDMIDLELDGRYITAQLAVLFPYATKVIGSSVFGDDATLTINSVDGQQRIYKAAAVLKMPSLRFGRKVTLMGPMQFGCLYEEDTTPQTANSLFTDSATAYPGDTGYDAAAILTQVYDCVWGATAPFDSFGSVNGVTVDFKLDTSVDETEAFGIFDYVFQNLEVTAKLEPDGVTPAEVLAAMKIQGTGAVLGRSLKAQANDLIITGTGVYFKMNKAAIVPFEEHFSSSKRRVGQVEFRATRTVTTGALDPLFVISNAAP